MAARSGLGWYGKHTNIIVPQHGSFVMLGELLVDLDLPPDQPLERNCGSCAICLHKCPTGAIREPYLVHAPDCISFQTIEQRGPIPETLRAKMGNWVFGCDICQDVCPYTGAAREMIDDAFSPATIDNAFPSLAWLIEMDESAFRADLGNGGDQNETRRPGKECGNRNWELRRHQLLAGLETRAVQPRQTHGPLTRSVGHRCIETRPGGQDILRMSMKQERDEAVLVALQSAADTLDRSLMQNPRSLNPHHVNISETTIRALVTAAVQSCYGIVGVGRASKPWTFSHRSRKPSIEIRQRDESVFVQIPVIVEYGLPVVAVAQNLIRPSHSNCSRHSEAFNLRSKSR